MDVQPYSIDKAKEEISLNDKAIKLTKKEYDLAVFLFKNVGRVISRDHIMESVWGKYSDLNTRTVDTHISRIRSKLKIGEENGWRLNSIYMHGYRLDQLG
jgi:DNA-binding response OmpR family regulator